VKHREMGGPIRCDATHQCRKHDFEPPRGDCVSKVPMRFTIGAEMTVRHFSWKEQLSMAFCILPYLSESPICSSRPCNLQQMLLTELALFDAILRHHIWQNERGWSAARCQDLRLLSAYIKHESPTNRHVANTHKTCIACFLPD
jgi:hypothetical protein